MRYVRQLDNPIHAITRFVENSVQNNAKLVRVMPCTIDNRQFLVVADNGQGATGEHLQDSFHTFGKTGDGKQGVQTDSVWWGAEHGMSLKIGILRIGRSGLVLSRTNEGLAVALVSEQFMIDAGAHEVLVPVLRFTVEGEKLSALDPKSDALLAAVKRYTGLFGTLAELQVYVNRELSQCGFYILIGDQRNPNDSQIKHELVFTNNDLQVRSEVLESLYLPSSKNLLENSLEKSVNYLYIKHPPEFSLQIENMTYKCQNPYDLLC
jgi:hypothetical protein